MQPLGILIGTGRHARISDRIAYASLHITKSNNIDASLIDIRDYADPFTGRVKDGNVTATRWIQQLSKIDGLLLIVPEYNHSYPGELKLLLDRAYTEYENKSVGIVSVSTGKFGGARMVEHLQPTLTYLGMQYHGAVHVSAADKAVNEAGHFIDEKTVEAIKKLLEKMH